MKRILPFILALLFICTALPAFAGNPGTQTGAWAIVQNPDQGDRLNLRAGPGTGYPSLGKYFSGTAVEVLSREGDWYRVRVGSGAGSLTGYMKGEFLLFPGEKHGPIFATPMVHLAVIGQMETMWVYGSSDFGTPAVASLRGHTPVTVLGLCGNDAHIAFGGVTAFVNANAVYMGDHPEGLQGATLTMNGERVTLDSPDDLAALSNLLVSARPIGYGMAGCPFTATLTLYTSYDTVEVQLATDSCRIFRYNGYDYQYDGADNSALFALFGMTPR